MTTEPGVNVTPSAPMRRGPAGIDGREAESLLAYDRPAPGPVTRNTHSPGQHNQPQRQENLR